MRLSQVLVLLAAEPEERITFRDILAILSERSFAPGIVLRGSVARSDVLRAVKRALPVVSRLERWSRPRLSVFEPRIAALLSALLLLLMSTGMLLAAPLVGQVPYGLAVCLFGLGQIERDGVLVLSGMVAGAVGVALSASFIYGVIEAIRSLL